MTGTLESAKTIGLLLSGGLDSAVLTGHLLTQGYRIQPLYIRSAVVWQAEELHAIERFLQAIESPRLAELVTLDLPLPDLYGDHWSLDGRQTPGAETADESVYLPGRNPLLLIKAIVWCHLHGVDRLAIALLQSNPFADATPRFFDDFSAALNLALDGHVKVIRPFASMHKAAVMRLGQALPLEWTFSCIAPRGGLHCGSCNKCAERQAAFRSAEMVDSTLYHALGELNRDRTNG